MADRLDALFRPRSIAVIGASRHRDKIGYILLHNLLVNEFQGTIYPVNRTAHAVHGIKAYPSVKDIPHEVDMAVIVVPAEHVLGVAEECGQKGVKGLVVITAGFSETGEAGAQRERELLRIVRHHKMVMVGPNCMGVLNTDPEVRMDATFAPTAPLAGNVSFTSQSGALGVAILDQARRLNIGIAKFVSLGNKADVSGNDLLEAWEDDPATKLILMYIESFGNPRNYIRIARNVVRKKPILALKSGRTEAGARATKSHTGALGGSDVAADAVFEQTGTLRVASIEELFDAAMAFSLQELPRGRRVAIVSDAGGPAVMCTDELIAQGLEIAKLQAGTKKALWEAAPESASVENPVDMTAHADAQKYTKALDLVLTDPGVDAAIVIYVPPVVKEELAFARGVWETARRHGKTVLCNFLGRSDTSEGFVELVSHNIPTYLFPESAARALAAMVQYREVREQPPGELRRFPVDTVAAAKALQRGGRGPRTELEGLALLQAYGIPVARTLAAGDLAAVLAAATQIGYPVALKATGPDLLHKSEAKAVILDLREEGDLRAAFTALQDRLATRKIQPEGYLVQEFLRGGKECLLGMHREPKFGPLLAFGLGGIYVEHLKDVAWGLSPITDADAARMVRSIRSYPLLQGVRGEPPSDIPAIEECLLRLSQLVEDHPEIQEIDLNPMFVREAGKGAQVVDGRFIL